MPNALHLVSVRLLYPFAAALRDESIDLDPLLIAAAIPRTTYDNTDSRIHHTAMRCFHFAAANRSCNPALGLTAARHHALAQFQLLEYFLASNGRLDEALGALMRFKAVLSDGRELSLEPRAEGQLLRVDPVTEGAHPCFFEFVIGTLYLVGKRIVGSCALKLSDATDVRRAPRLRPLHAAKLDRLCRCPHRSTSAPDASFALAAERDKEGIAFLDHGGQRLGSELPHGPDTQACTMMLDHRRQCPA